MLDVLLVAISVVIGLVLWEILERVVRGVRVLRAERQAAREINQFLDEYSQGLHPRERLQQFMIKKGEMKE